MQYVLCDVWCVMCQANGRPKLPHLGSFRTFKWYSQIDHRWQSYVHFILQGLLILNISLDVSGQKLFSTWESL